MLINTVHVLYAWHPLHLAKFGAALDHISGGRWGINVVTGYKPSEYRMFGLEPIEHDLRYVMADEFTTIMERLWTEDEELSFDGQVLARRRRPSWRQSRDSGGRSWSTPRRPVPGWTTRRSIRT